MLVAIAMVPSDMLSPVVAREVHSEHSVLCTEENPSENPKLAIDTNSSSRGIPGEVYEVLYRLADKWADVPDVMNLVLKPLKGAMTNHVYECQWPQQEADSIRKVLVRVYGDGCEVFFRRENEIHTFERMSQLGQGPRLLARFPNGRVEEFLNARTLRAVDLRDSAISARIAAKLREFHQLDMQGPHEPQLWNRIRFWIDKALEICPQICHEEFQLETLKEEVSELQSKLSKSGERIGFCHNDLQYGNIMMDETNGVVTIIDYEYASFNPVAFDIANHFCEMTSNYHTETPHVLDSSKYPDFKERSRFIEAYLKASGGVSTALSEGEELVEEVECYTLASHLHWGLWGILSSTFSNINFDYLEYARQRCKLYYSSKPSLL